MAQVNLPSVDGITTLDQVKNALGRVNKELTWLLQNLDTRNINELNAEKIVAGSIQAEKLAAGSVTAEKIEVDELSAISADLGTITAGLIESIQIFGSYIATRNGTYPRAEMSNTDDLFGAYFDENEAIKIQADYSGSPSLNFFHAGNIVARLDMLLGYLETSAIGNYEINTSNNGYIYLNPGGSGAVQISHPDFSKLRNQSTTLQAELNSKASASATTDPAGSHNHGIAPGTQLMVAGGGFVTWVGAGDHVHDQN